MTDLRKPTTLGQGSLWTTPVAVGGSPLSDVKVDRSVSADRIRQALDESRERVGAFTGQISEEVLRTSF
jgi:hypothetical protein